MKKINNLLIIALLTISGCSIDNKTSNNVITNATDWNKRIDDLYSIDYLIDMNFEIYNKETNELIETSTTKYVYSNGNAHVYGETEMQNIYYSKEGQKYYYYSKESGEWDKIEIDYEDYLESVNPMKEYIYNNFDQFTYDKDNDLYKAGNLKYSDGSDTISNVIIQFKDSKFYHYEHEQNANYGINQTNVLIRYTLDFKYEFDEKVNVPEVHIHNFDDIWHQHPTENDDKYHYHICDCNEVDISSREEHIFNDEYIYKVPTKEENGIKRKTCSICNYNKDTIFSYEEYNALVSDSDAMNEIFENFHNINVSISLNSIYRIKDNIKGKETIKNSTTQYIKYNNILKKDHEYYEKDTQNGNCYKYYEYEDNDKTHNESYYVKIDDPENTYLNFSHAFISYFIYIYSYSTFDSSKLAYVCDKENAISFSYAETKLKHLELKFKNNKLIYLYIETFIGNEDDDIYQTETHTATFDYDVSEISLPSSYIDDSNQNHHYIYSFMTNEQHYADCKYCLSSITENHDFVQTGKTKKCSKCNYILNCEHEIGYYEYVDEKGCEAYCTYCDSFMGVFEHNYQGDPLTCIYCKHVKEL